MTGKSGLAAVATAAAGSAAPNAQEPMTAERLRAEHPDVYAAVFESGAQSEHERILGIEKAQMPGHKKLIDAHKADRSKTPADAALAVISAEKAKRREVSDSLEKDEDAVKGTSAAPRSGVDQPEKDRTPQNPIAAGYELAEKAKQYRAEQSAKGITISAAEAVAHVEKEK